MPKVPGPSGGTGVLYGQYSTYAAGLALLAAVAGAALLLTTTAVRKTTYAANHPAA